ncbi:MAG: hypothetical protein ABI717_00480 [Actinomycetota bacterium]
MILAPGAAIAALALVAAGAPHGAGRERPLASLSASPTRIALSGSSRTSVTLTNFGASPAQVSVGRGSFTLDLRGRPAVGRPGLRSAQSWLVFRPSALSIAPGGKAELEVAARVPARARPGDHHALLLLLTRPSRVGGVGVRMRLGVRVAVRVPGKVVRRVAVRGLRVRRSGRSRNLDVTLANLGDLIETNVVTVVLSARGRVERVSAEVREVLPRTRAILTARYAGRLRGRVIARVEVDGTARRTFTLRL